MRRTKTEYTPANSSKNCAPMDLNMSIMDGFQVLHKLKSNPETEHIPVIILTARIDIESERRCLQEGVTDYIKKPWDPAELQERIAIIVGPRELEREGYVTKSAKTGESGGATRSRSVLRGASTIISLGEKDLPLRPDVKIPWRWPKVGYRTLYSRRKGGYNIAGHQA